MSLPLHVPFEGRQGRYSYRRLGFRPPLKGEYYLSGAIVQAWRAPNDLTTPYHVVEIGEKFVSRQTWVRDE